MAGIGPAPFAAMMLADQGAEVIRIDRPGVRPDPTQERFDVLARGRSRLSVDLRQPGAAQAVLELVARADALVEGFRLQDKPAK